MKIEGNKLDWEYKENYLGKNYRRSNIYFIGAIKEYSSNICGNIEIQKVIFYRKKIEIK